ncbi:hypothetical protein [Methylocystis sp.]|uniref:hypothetical protein n=1 Tax=Methylocystis sp. TaxID=1911079 RepID=UPI003D10EE99
MGLFAASTTPGFEHPGAGEEHHEIDNRGASDFRELIRHAGPKQKGQEGDYARDKGRQERIMIHPSQALRTLQRRRPSRSRLFGALSRIGNIDRRAIGGLVERNDYRS